MDGKVGEAGRKGEIEEVTAEVDFGLRVCRILQVMARS